MQMLNTDCRHDISDDDANRCWKHGYIVECPVRCQNFAPAAMSRELREHYERLAKHYNKEVDT